MPRTIPRRPTREQLVNKYGFSLQAIRIFQEVTPHLPPSKVVEGWAAFLLKAESLEEKRWQTMGIPLLEDHYGMKIKLWKPKAFSFKLPGGSYSPDFFYIFENGMRLHIEVKANKFQANYRDARSKILAAATLYWFDNFMMVTRGVANGWDLEEIPPDKDFQTELQVLADELQNMIEKEQI